MLSRLTKQKAISLCFNLAVSGPRLISKADSLNGLQGRYRAGIHCLGLLSVAPAVLATPYNSLKHTQLFTPVTLFTQFLPLGITYQSVQIQLSSNQKWILLYPQPLWRICVPYPSHTVVICVVVEPINFIIISCYESVTLCPLFA